MVFFYMYIPYFFYAVSEPGKQADSKLSDPVSRAVFAIEDARLAKAPPSLARYRSRSNRLLMTVLDGVRESLRGYSPDRIGVVIGTSSAGIAEGEAALKYRLHRGTMPTWFHYKQQELGGAAEFAARWLGIRGPAYTVSTSCASGAHALVCAGNLLRLKVCDAVVAAGVETLSGTTVQGFASLGALSGTRCNPFSRHRDGTILGEGAAVFLLTRNFAPLALMGAGMSSDAYHLSAPDPAGRGAKLAMSRALREAGLCPQDIGYLNLHGTATGHNDAMEARAVRALFGGAPPPSSSTKPLTGHCLGASGAVEAAICGEALLDLDKPLPRHEWDGCGDPELPALHFTDGREKIDPDKPFCMSNTYAFGGANISLILGRADL